MVWSMWEGGIWPQKDIPPVLGMVSPGESETHVGASALAQGSPVEEHRGGFSQPLTECRSWGRMKLGALRVLSRWPDFGAASVDFFFL